MLMTELSFGVSVSTSAVRGADPVAAARRAEALGFDFVSAPDHPSGAHPSYETCQVNDAEMEPKPQGRIPIWLGTFGKRALSPTGRLADGWIPSLSFASPGVVPAMRDGVLTAARYAGREPEKITGAYHMEIRIDERCDQPPSVVSGSAVG
jgi:alkanesulfonate monooxygenase SsuD/methylene tetrahydromethanopterin reductase-like flavin-dependent oxidoreductase (luciferase family)